VAKRGPGTLVTLCAVLGLDGMDVASMSPTPPAIQEELGMSATSLQWVVSAYVIGYGGFVLLGGRRGHDHRVASR
jgi:MFS family permease